MRHIKPPVYANLMAVRASVESPSIHPADTNVCVQDLPAPAAPTPSLKMSSVQDQEFASSFPDLSWPGSMLSTALPFPLFIPYTSLLHF